ncbi:MAG: DUF349 domain-containing protein [Flavobacteriaceae bacterium]|nr:DUF349 domain-containing protein [Flavobacteriaceae bacterium]
MSENANLQEADGIEKNENTGIEDSPQESLPASEAEIPQKDTPEESTTEKGEPSDVKEETDSAKADAAENDSSDSDKVKPDDVHEEKDSTSAEATENESSDSAKVEPDGALEEIDSANAEAAENGDLGSDDKEEEKDFSKMSMEDLIQEMEALLKTEKIQFLKRPMELIRSSFNKQFGALLESKKAEFLEAGGNSIDFRFDFPLKSKFNTLFKTYREQRQEYYKNLEKTLSANLENRLEIIEEIKGLLNVEENINTTYKHFKALQERWRNAGPIPRDRYNNVWNNYHHHVENFYDFLHLNRDLRELDFKHNLEEKNKIIERAEELIHESDSNRSFRELQALHKMWKEELGPVAKEHREELWERFRAATKAIHEKRQEYLQKMDEAYLKNLEVKQEIIDNILAITADESNNHQSWQNKIKKVENLRQQFFNAGKVPIKVNEATWAKFKESVRAFNRKKNLFYKSLKKEQYENLNKKLELIKIAEEKKDSDDFESVTPIMKKIQKDWKAIGHVPRRESDKIWKEFKNACNHYFNRLHAQRNEANKEDNEAYDRKVAALEALKTLELGKELDEGLKIIKQQIENWKTLGKVPYKKYYIEGKFNKAINALYNKLDADPSEIELLKYDSKLESIAQTDDRNAMNSEHNFIRKRIDEVKAEINQLENNLQFFSNVKDDNPVVVEVQNKIDKHKDHLEILKQKLKRIKKFY